MGRSSSSTTWRTAAAATFCVGVFLALTLPSMPTGPVIGTGQDEWYNAVRALQALYEHLDPSYFIHPALYYELLALLYGFARVLLSMTGTLGTSTFLAYFLANQPQFLDWARYASVAYGALAVIAAVWLGDLLAGPRAALLGGLIIASLPLLHELAVAIRVDALFVAAMLAAAALIVRHYVQASRNSLAIAGAGIGVAAAANYPGALLLLPLAWLEWIRPGGGRPSRLRNVAVACGVALVVFIALNPYALIDLRAFLRWFSFQAQLALATHPHDAQPHIWRYVDLLLDQGWPVVLSCIAGVAALAGLRTPTGALAAFALLYLAAFSAMQTQYDRFVLPAVAILCIAGAARAVQLAGRLGGRAVTGCTLAAALLILWSGGSRVARERPGTPNRGPDYRAQMLDWIAENVPPTATLVMESDTLPLLQTIYDPDTAGGPFHTALQDAFRALHPRLPTRIVKAQYIAAVYNYDPRLLEGGQVFFLASSQNREYIAANRAALPQPAAFYDSLDTRATVVHETRGMHERLMLYAAGGGAR